MNALLLVLFVGAVISLWLHFDRMHRFALLAARRRCQEMDVQLLDQTVVLRGLRIARGASGWLALISRYSFEFATTGDRRYKGEVQLLGRKLLSVDLGVHVIH